MSPYKTQIFAVIWIFCYTRLVPDLYFNALLPWVHLNFSCLVVLVRRTSKVLVNTASDTEAINLTLLLRLINKTNQDANICKPLADTKIQQKPTGI